MRVTSLVSVTAAVLAVGLFSACGQGDSTGGGFGLTDDDGGSSSGSSTHDGGGSSSGGHSSSSGGSSSGGESSSSGSSSGTASSSGSSSGSSGGACGACTKDSDCQSSCPPVQGGGTNCCDVGSGVCYATTQSTCPVPSDGGAD